MIKTFDFSRHLLPEKSSRMTKEALRYDFDRVRKLNNSDRKKKAIIRK